MKFMLFISTRIMYELYSMYKKKFVQQEMNFGADFL